MTIWGDLISSSDDGPTFINWRPNMAFHLRSATETTIHHLENAFITTTEKTPTKQDKGKVMIELFFY